MANHVILADIIFFTSRSAAVSGAQSSLSGLRRGWDDFRHMKSAESARMRR